MPTNRKHQLLLASMLLWLCCSWIVQQQPVVVKKTKAKTSAKLTPHKSTTSGPKKTTEKDPQTGLVVASGLSLVKGQCTVCHSSKLILQSHFSRSKWIERIRWMQKTQKLWELGETEKPILDYLTTYYGPVDSPFDGRRLPLSPQQWYSIP